MDCRLARLFRRADHLRRHFDQGIAFQRINIAHELRRAAHRVARAVGDHLQHNLSALNRQRLDLRAVAQQIVGQVYRLTPLVAHCFQGNERAAAARIGRQNHRRILDAVAIQIAKRDRLDEGDNRARRAALDKGLAFVVAVGQSDGATFLQLRGIGGILESLQR